MNFDYVIAAPTLGPDCLLRSRDHNAAVPAILSHYADPRVRRVALRAMAAMHRAGFGSLRVLVWFGQNDDDANDRFDVARPAVAGANLAAYVRDALSVGFSRVYVSFSPIGKLSPTCRRRTWGDCFDQATIQASIRFILGARASLDEQSAASVYVDLYNEGGLARFAPRMVLQNMIAFLGDVLGAYHTRYPIDRTGISLQESDLLDRVGFVMRAYQAAGLRPSFWDLHLYNSDRDTVQFSDRRLMIALRTSRSEITVGEAVYGSPASVDTLSKALLPLGKLFVVFWPVLTATPGCKIQIGLPYSLGWLHP